MYIFSGTHGDGVLLKCEGVITRVVILRGEDGRLRVGIEAPQQVQIVRVREVKSEEVR